MEAFMETAAILHSTSTNLYTELFQIYTNASI